MSEFRTDVDVANRGLQHCGATRISALTDNSKNAAEVSFVYGKLREAELRRNVWTFATRRAVLRAIDAGTMLLAPALWVNETTYFVGSIVSDQNENLWISKIPNNTSNDPLLSMLWEPYFGPLTASLYSSGVSYYSGEIVYTTPGNGTSRIYLSLQNGNTDVPGTPTAYNAAAVYSKNQVVTYLSVASMSLFDLNTGNLPSASAPPFNISTTYGAGDAVAGSDGVKYTSIAGGNLGNDPTLDLAGALWTNTGIKVPWTTVFVGGTGSAKWLQIGGAEFQMGVGLATMNIVYPLGVGPSSQPSTRNIFKLPSGFLREAPQNPKATTAPLGGPTGITYNDWNFEAGFLLSGDAGPIPLRFVANISDVRRMDPMFCEGLAARVGMEVCEPLTQSTSKLGNIAKIYSEWMGEARTVNAIEQGYDEPPEDEFISVRA